MKLKFRLIATAGAIAYFLLLSFCFYALEEYREFFSFPVSLTAAFAFTLIPMAVIFYIGGAYTSMEKNSGTDALTRIDNRRRFSERIEREILRARRYSRNLSLIVFDLDDFRIINNSYGHQVGDLILQSVSKLIATLIRNTDIFARWGGEEFVLLLPETNGKHAFFVAERLRHILESYHFDKKYRVTASIGLTEFQKEDTAETFLKRADDASILAKNAGKNRVIMLPDIRSREDRIF